MNLNQQLQQSNQQYKENISIYEHVTLENMERIH